ncbi:MAG: methionine gamma-lyase family protein [Acutalibacteraceae bacterium]|nr:methionine gamma-lyase family protein [Acutalibacteraceae bacterium]
MEQNFFKIDSKVSEAAKKALEAIEPQFKTTDEITEYNQQKVLSAFINNHVSESMFAESTGYGYGDRGREVIDRVFADIVGAEDALVRHNFTCGTHTLAVALYGMLRPGDIMLCVTGTPYDTIHSVIGIDGKGDGSLADYGIIYKQVDLKDGKPDLEAIREAVTKEKIKLVYIQRSRGYSLRPSLSCEEIGEIAKVVKANSDADIMVDNCYGEFTQTIEPTQVGADIIAGSLIKNAGGGLARTGGYVAGRADLVEKISYRLTTPGLGREVGATLGMSRELFMGLFFAPHTVGEAIKAAYFTAALFEQFGFETTPTSKDPRFDIVQSVLLRNEENLIAFCQGMQSGAPIDAFVTPEPWDMPGYDSKVIMAAGAFIGGASIELSADAPLREPYAAWMQGGLNFHSAKMGIMLAAQKMAERGLI